ncbi:ATP-grasp domain-containing protein [Streptomyces sp. H27-S2]|uniref:ATP-grasp domain-containing protein n=1 Tax=Streptomyces antarcticus TaxID=2996458 RepID=UPI002271BED3|nr:ATP-grasp domain-containing protein [Streptomyces sp. H27-S2]MCY0950467.1 ATP-grasp domain-containing protein [Streptomyces sp. H27-S2]
MRVLVLGEFRVDRLVPVLERSGADVTVLGFGDLTGFLRPEVTCAPLPPDLTEETLMFVLERYRADTVVPNMASPGQEQMLALYARLGARLRDGDRHMPVHSKKFAALACDKVALHRYAVQRGWPAPAAIVCDGPGQLAPAARKVGFPLLVKKARTESFAGRHFISDPSRLAAVAAGLTYPVLVQQAVQGEEFAVELLTLPSGTVAWPVASLGTLDSACAPGRRARVQPAALPEDAAAALAAVIRDIATHFRPVGPWQIDFAVTREGRLNLIELNGRFGGVSNMSWTSTGTDPHHAHAQAVLHSLLPARTRAEQVALEVPVANGTTLPPPPAGTALTAFTANPGFPGPYTSGFHKAVLAIPPAHAAPARAWLRGLPSGTLLVPVESAVGRLDHGLDALGANPTVAPLADT